MHVRVVIIRNTQHDALFFLPSAQQYSSLFFSLSFAKRRFRLEPGEIVGRLRQVLLWAIECHGFFSFIARETARENVFVFCLFCFNFVVACRLGVFVFGKSVMPELLLHISNAVRKRGKCGNGWLADGGCLPPSSSLLEYFEAFVLAMRAQDTKKQKKNVSLTRAQIASNHKHFSSGSDECYAELRITQLQPAQQKHLIVISQTKWFTGIG